MCIPDVPYSPRRLVTPGNALKGQCVSGHGSPIWAPVSPNLVPRPHMKRESGLVSTVCAYTNDSGILLQTSPIMDKLHIVVMRRNTQTRYTACSVAAVFTRRWLPLSETQGVTRQGLLQPPPVSPSLCL